MRSVRFSTSDFTVVTEQQAAAAAAVGRVLDVNPVLLRSDTPLDHFGCDSVALIAISDALSESGLTIDLPMVGEVPQITTFGDLLALVGPRHG